MTLFAQVAPYLPRKLLLLLGCFLPAIGSAQNTSDSAGSLSIKIKRGTSLAPSYLIVSPGYKERLIYQGLSLSASENTVSFSKFPSISNPGNLIGPFRPGVLGSIRARASSVLDENGSISEIDLTDPGLGYNGVPLVHLAPPSEANGTADQVALAFAEAQHSSITQIVENVDIVSKGRGYRKPPEVSIEGGPCFLRITDPESILSGTFFKILSNTDDVLKLSNPTNIDLSSAILPSSMVEVFQGWTLGSLLGYEETTLNSNLDPDLADWVYILKQPDQQTGQPDEDYSAHFHDGSKWVDLNTNLNSSNTILMPDESFILVRRQNLDAELSISGIAHIKSSAWEIPPFGKRNLVCNPFPSDIMLSDLFNPDSITTEANETNGHLWLSNPNQDLADNIHVLEAGTWTTYWHDGSNIHLTIPAEISVRRGSGVGGALTRNDFSFTSGTIEHITNPASGNVKVTSTAHGLKNGFLVTISSVTGYLTNQDKIQLNASSELVEDGYGLVVSSMVNGVWEVVNCTPHTFELKNSFNNCDFVPSPLAKWKTGTQGLGYDSDVQISIRGGGGRNGQAIGKVVDGKIDKIIISSGGLLYTSPTYAKVHAGGWRSISRGNAPLNDKLIPAGSGVLIERKHPHGISFVLPLLPFINQSGN